MKRDGFTTVKISKHTKDIINKEVVDEIHNHSPELKGVHLTMEYKIRRVVEYYLK